MALYKVMTKGQDKARLVEAVSQSAAIAHVALGVFTVETVKKPSEVAAIMAQGVALETAGEEPAAEAVQTGTSGEALGNDLTQDPKVNPPGNQGGGEQDPPNNDTGGKPKK